MLIFVAVSKPINSTSPLTNLLIRQTFLRTHSENTTHNKNVL